MLSNLDLQDDKPETNHLGHCVALRISIHYPHILL